MATSLTGKEEEVMQEETNSIQNSSQTNTTTVATVNDDYKKKPLLEWTKADVQNFLNADEDYCTIASKFPFNGAKLAKLKKETIQQEIGNLLGEALFYDIQDILKKDQEKANPNKTIQFPSTNVKIGDIPKTAACDKENSFVKVDLLDSGLNQLPESLITKEKESNRVLYIRKECSLLWTHLIGSSNLLIQGPPGTGKSSVVWAWCLNFCSQNHSKHVRWIHLSHRSMYVMDFNQGKYISSSFEPATFSMSTVTDCDVIVLDGIAQAFQSVYVSVLGWAGSRATVPRLIFVSSVQFFIRDEDERALGIKTIHVAGWTLNDYLATCNLLSTDATSLQLPLRKQQQEFWDSVKNNVDPPTSVPNFPSGLIKKKHDIAGASARWMFSFTIEDVKQNISKHFNREINMMQLIQGLTGDSSVWAVNHLVTKFRESRLVNGKQEECLVGSIVSKLVLEKLIERTGIQFIVEAENRITKMSDTFSGWIFQAEFLLHLEENFKRKVQQQSIRVRNAQGHDVYWKIDSVTKFKQEEEIPNLIMQHTNCWLIPTKINQGCYDVLYISNHILHVIQITVANTHDFKMKYVVSVLKRLQAKFSNYIHKVELCVVIPQKDEIIITETEFKPGKFYAEPKVEWKNVVNPATDERTSLLTKMNWKPQDLKIFTFQRGQPQFK